MKFTLLNFVTVKILTTKMREFQRIYSCINNNENKHVKYSKT